MSLRNRIVVMFVLMVLVVPATGWAASQELNPDGRQLTAVGNDSLGIDTTTESPQAEDVRLAAAKARPGATSFAGFFDRFLVWLQAIVQPL